MEKTDITAQMMPEMYEISFGSLYSFVKIWGLEHKLASIISSHFRSGKKMKQARAVHPRAVATEDQTVESIAIVCKLDR